MSVPTLADLRTHLGDLLVDPDGVVPTATRDRFLNEAYVEWMGSLDDRPRELTATVTGLSFGASDRSSIITQAALVREPLGLFTSASAGSALPLVQLEWLEPHELQAEWEVNQAVGTPLYWTAWRVGTATAADVGRWKVGVHPVPAGTSHFILRALVDPTPLVNSTDKPDVTDLEAYALARVGAARLALTMGRDDGFIAQLWQGVPERMQSAFRSQTLSKGPRPRPEERPA